MSAESKISLEKIIKMSLKKIIIFSILLMAISHHTLYAQCEFITPPPIKKTYYADREVVFSKTTINGKNTTYMAVEKGASITITTELESKKNGNYCPDCIVQIYWGIRGHASVCAKSFHGYQFNKKKSKLKFKAPLEDGIYYITMGAVLDYSCKNNNLRPFCEAKNAFAVLKVGNPDPEKKIAFETINKDSKVFLKATLVKSGCFRNLDEIEWFLDGKQLPYDNQKEIPLLKNGNYKVRWSNCLDDAEDSFLHNAEENKTISLKVKNNENNAVNKKSGKLVQLSVDQKSNPIEDSDDKKVAISIKTEEGASSPDDSDISKLIENNDNFVLKNLIFDLGKSDIKPEAEEDLNKLAEIMKSKPTMKILLEGHTDRRGSARKNLKLSEERVKSTKEYLIKQGVASNNIDTQGWGHQKPLIITNNVEEGEINRRVEIKILSR